jgi:hypothetical protein
MSGRLNQRVEHRLQVERRSADDLEHVGGCSLLFAGFRQFVGKRPDLLLQIGI